MTEQTLANLRAFVASNAGADKDRYTAALDELMATIAGQAMVTRALAMTLRTKQVNSDAMNALLDANTLSASFQGVGKATKNTFTMADAEAASKKLASDIASATDFKNILSSVVGIVKVFM